MGNATSGAGNKSNGIHENNVGQVKARAHTTADINAKSQVEQMSLYEYQHDSGRMWNRSKSALVELPSVLNANGYQIRSVEKLALEFEDDRYSMQKKKMVYGELCSMTRTSTKTNNIPITQKQVHVRDFDIVKVIGTGSMGKVILVRKINNGMLYAMKIFSKGKVIKNGWADKIISERDVLGGTVHDFLVNLYWAFQTQTSLFLVMEYCPGGELSNQIRLKGRFSERTTTFYAAEIALGLEHLHRHGIIYRYALHNITQNRYAIF